jgi:hypothetical protein
MELVIASQHVESYVVENDDKPKCKKFESRFLL